MVDVDITGRNYVGALGGGVGNIETCFSTGKVSGESRVGSLVGNGNGLVSNSYSTAAVSGGSGLINQANVAGYLQLYFAVSINSLNNIASFI